MMGPRTGNAQKTGKTRRKWVFFNSTIEIARNLKISMLQLAITTLWLFGLSLGKTNDFFLAHTYIHKYILWHILLIDG